METVKTVEVKFKINIQEDSWFDKARLRAEMALFAQHLLTSYDETIIEGDIDGAPISFAEIPIECYQN